MVYQVVCERLEMIDRVMDAVESFHQMTSELGREMNLHGEHSEWALGDRDAGFNWAWSDTCCIDKSDHFVLQEALVAMFKWYQGSAMMIVFLRGIRSSSRRGALGKFAAAPHYPTRARTQRLYKPEDKRWQRGQTDCDLC